MSRNIGLSRFRSPLVISLTAVLLLAGIVGAVRFGGAQASVPVPQGVAPNCNNPLVPARGDLALDPASGPPGAMFDANLSDLANHPNGPWPVEVLWDRSRTSSGEIIGEGESPAIAKFGQRPRDSARGRDSQPAHGNSMLARVRR